MNRVSLESLSKDALIALVLAQAEQNQALAKRVAELEAKLGQPPKTPSNSATPPSKGEKRQRPEKPKKRRKGRPGVTRQLAQNPDKVVDATAEACPNCGHGLTVDDQPDVYAYDHVELPPIKPETTRVRNVSTIMRQSGW
jgi:transposase